MRSRRILPVLIASCLLSVALLSAPHARATDEATVRGLIEQGDPGAVEAATAWLDTAERDHGNESPAAATARDLLVEALWKSPAVSDPSTLELAEETLTIKAALYGEKSTGYARSLYNVAVIHDIQRNLDVAGEHFARVVEILDSVPDPPADFVARAWLGYGNNRRAVGEMAQALEAYERATDVLEQSGEARSRRMVDVLSRRGATELAIGRVDEAEARLREGQALSAELLGPDNPQTCQFGTSLAACSYNRGDFAAAGSRQREALECLEASLPQSDQRVLRGLTNLAWLDSELGNYAAADSAYQVLLDIHEAEFGVDHFQTLRLRRIYGAHLYYSGAYTAALPQVQIAVDGMRLNPGDKSPETNDAISTLAEIHRVLGDYDEARELYLEAAELLEAEDLDSAALALRYNGLGMVALDLGDPLEARGWFEKALARSLESEGEVHYHTGRAVANLGDAAEAAGDVDGALAHYERALQIFDASLGPGSPDAMQASVVLGRLHARNGDFDGAVVVLESARESLEAMDLPQAAWLGMCLHETARIRLQLGDFAEAIELESEAIEYLADGHGPESVQVAWSLITRGWAHLEAGELERAFEDAVEAERIGGAHFDDLIRWLPERTALTWAQRRPRGGDLLWEVAVTSGQTRHFDGAWAHQVQSRAGVFDELARRARFLARSGDPALEPLIDELRRARERLATVTLDGNSSVDVVRRAMEARDRAEAAFVAASAESLHEPDPRVESIPERLPGGGALCSFVLVRDVDGTPRRYLAVTRGSGSDAPRLVDLGAAPRVDRLVEEWAVSMREGLLAVGPFAEPAIARTREAGARLREMIWDPLDLGAVDRVFVVADGTIHGVSFDALPAGEQGWLVDEGPTFVYLSAERELLRDRAPRAPAGELLCVGNPDFDRHPEPTVVASAQPTFRGGQATCEEFSEIRFASLPQTDRELATVTGLWDGDAPVVLSGLDASEDRVREEVAGKSVLHFATHAFYLGQTCLDPQDPREQALIQNPLLLSGLALAGANDRSNANSDGILTAEEVASLDLAGTGLAVLSACETGGGTTVTGEGILGLRRAFRLAGVESLVCSLWPVEDEAAAQWMAVFYEALWSGGEDLASAARSASREVRSGRAASGQSTHPAHWAAFVVSATR